MPIKYRAGYKYVLAEDHSSWVGLLAGVDTPFIKMADGEMTISKGYAWDGPSGPTIDTPAFMRGSLVHDALYQLIRGGLLPKDDREVADDILKRIVREDGMTKTAASLVHWAVRLFGGRAAKVGRPVIIAPRASRG